MKRIDDQRFLALEIPRDELVAFLLARVKIQPEGADIPDDLRIAEFSTAPDMRNVRIVLESDRLPEMCKYRGYFNFYPIQRAGDEIHLSLPGKWPYTLPAIEVPAVEKLTLTTTEESEVIGVTGLPYQVVA